jgi:uncharacterized protein
MFPFMSPLWLILIGPCALLALYAQFKVKSAFAKYNRVPASSGLTGAQAAREMLNAARLDNVAIERIDGFLSNHYDPKSKVLRLSSEVYNGRSLASVGVACHEAGHAMQDATAYAPLALRNAIVPTASIGSSLGIILIILGMFITPQLAILGLLLYGTVVVFQIVNLPVEFNASSRAKVMLGQLGIVQGRQEAAGVASVLDAAALTYVAATITAIAYLFYYALLIFGGRRD